MAFISSNSYRSRFSNNYIRSKFGTHSLPDVLVDAGIKFVLDKGAEATHDIIHKNHEKLRDIIKDYAISAGVKVGTIENHGKSLVNHSHDEVSFKHSVSSIQQSQRSECRIYKNTFQTGVPTSRSLYQFAKNKILDTKSLIDTERYYLSTEKRKGLGFNQRSYDFLGSDTFMKAKD